MVTLARQLERTENELADVRELVSVDDPELAEEARREVVRLEAAVPELEQRLKPLLSPRDPLQFSSCSLR